MFQPTGGKVIALDNGKLQLAVTVNSREAQINGVKQWLAFPAHFEDGHLLISRLDLAKVLEPRLRPQKVTGLGPVTTVVLDPGHGGHDKGAVSRYGYEKEAAAIQDLYLSGQKKEAAALVPAELLEATSLCGPESYIKERVAALAEVGVTHLNVTPVGPDPVAMIEKLRSWV